MRWLTIPKICTLFHSCTCIYDRHFISHVSMPRLRIRRMLFTVIIVICSTVLVLNLSSNSQQAMMVSSKSSERDFFPNLFETGVRRRPKFENSPTVLAQQSQEQLLVKSATDREIKKFLFKQVGSSNHHQMERSDNMMSGLLQNGHGQNGEVVKLWFMKGGGVRPQPAVANTKPYLWPEQDSGDRIVEQLMYVPFNYSSTSNLSSVVSTPWNASTKPRLKKILLYFGKGGWNDLPLGRAVFLRDKCPVNTCELSTSLKDAEQADALFFKDRFLWPFYKRKPNQVWILFLLECPLHTQAFKNLKHVFNWTATYRHDSDLVAPYEKFVSYSASFNYVAGQKAGAPRDLVNYAVNKTKKVAWFVSNCNAKNKRLEYAKELGQHIEVDIYGSCGNKKCPRTLTHKCFRMLDKEYKFYLAFENSNCKDYITEKFFVNGLSRNIVPIVMGARREDYARAAPPHSYIHVDDFASPKELAEHLDRVDKNDTLYNEYFRWKGTGEFVNTYFWCRMCAMLHAPPYHKSYPDMHKWWSGAGTCNAGNWRKQHTTTPLQTSTNTASLKDDNG